MGHYILGYIVLYRKISFTLKSMVVQLTIWLYDSIVKSHQFWITRLFGTYNVIKGWHNSCDDLNGTSWHGTVKWMRYIFFSLPPPPLPLFTTSFSEVLPNVAPCWFSIGCSRLCWYRQLFVSTYTCNSLDFSPSAHLYNTKCSFIGYNYFLNLILYDYSCEQT